MVEHFGDRIRKPIVIDPVDYEHADAALAYAEQIDWRQPSLNERITEIRHRISVLTDLDKVCLYNCSMSEALERDPSIEGIGDTVLDHAASDHYEHVELGFPLSMREHGHEKDEVAQIDATRNKLLKAGGKLFLRRKFRVEPQRRFPTDRID